MAECRTCTFSQWSSSLPAFAVAPLVAAPHLREQGRIDDAEKALDLVLACAQKPPPPGCSAAAHLAAEAEALALRNRWEEAEERYRQAITIMPHDTFRRSWWINLADIYIRLNDDSKKRAAWEAAKGRDTNEEITRRAIMNQTQAGVRAGGAPSRAAGTDSNGMERLPPRSPRSIRRSRVSLGDSPRKQHLAQLLLQGRCYGFRCLESHRTAITAWRFGVARAARASSLPAARAALSLSSAALGCSSLLVLAFWPTLRHFVYIWSTDENYSHGFLVPLISLYIANEAARRGPTTVRAGVGLGVMLLGMSLFGRLATIVVPVGIVGDGAFLLGLAGLCCLIFGTEALRRYGFALFFLVFMIPLPVALYAKIASPLQLMASQVASGFLNAIGIPVLREGNMMILPGDVRLFVAEACSGIRQLTGFLALTTAVAYLTARPLWYRGVLVASSIPIALTANVVRVALTGVIMYHFDPQYASGTFHTFEGLLMMAFGLAMLAAECWLLNIVVSKHPSRGDRISVGRLERQSALQQA